MVVPVMGRTREGLPAWQSMVGNWSDTNQASSRGRCRVQCLDGPASAPSRLSHSQVFEVRDALAVVRRRERGPLLAARATQCLAGGFRPSRTRTRFHLRLASLAVAGDLQSNGEETEKTGSPPGPRGEWVAWIEQLRSLAYDIPC